MFSILNKKETVSLTLMNLKMLATLLVFYVHGSDSILCLKFLKRVMKKF